MELDQLRNFLKIAKRGSFTRAAEDLGLSQPALSRSIQRLEEELGRPVLERQARAVKLTEAGMLLQARARDVLAILQDTQAEINDDGQTGRLRVGAIPTIAPYYLPTLLQSFSTLFPSAHLIVQEDTTDHLLKRCRDGEIDVALLALPIATKYLEVEALFEEELLVVMPPEHPLVKKRTMTLHDLQSQSFVMLDEVHCLSDSIVAFCRLRSFQPVAVEKASQLATVQELVSLGHGISMVPRMARKRDTDPRRVYRSLDGRKPTRKIAMAWNPYRFQSRLLEQFKQHIRVQARLS